MASTTFALPSLGTMLATCVVAVAIWLAVALLKWRGKMRAAVPGVPFLPLVPLLGNVLLLGKGIVKGFGEATKLGDVSSFWIFGRQVSAVPRCSGTTRHLVVVPCVATVTAAVSRAAA